jgi:hypothetical protein
MQRKILGVPDVAWHRSSSSLIKLPVEPSRIWEGQRSFPVKTLDGNDSIGKMQLLCPSK